MAVVEFLYEDLKKLVNLPKDGIIAALTEIGAPTAEGENGALVVEVMPNRPDLFFIEGSARAINSYINGKKYTYKTEKSKYAIMCDKNVSNIRPFVRAAVIMGLELNERTIKYLINAQEKLHETIGRKRRKVAIGIHNFDVVEFPLVYKAVEDARFVPLDYGGEINASEILEKHPKGIEYADIVKGKKLPMIMDKKGVISFPPIINSERTRLTEGTKNLLIDVTGTHEETVNSVLNMITCALADRGGVVYEVKVNGIPYPQPKPIKTKINMENIAKTLGVRLKNSEVKNLLSKMDYDISGYTVCLPLYRSDITHEIDIIEDIAIVYGYNNLKPTLPNFFTVGKLIEKGERIDEIIKGMGFCEVKTFILTNHEKIRECGFTNNLTSVLNPASEEYTTLRPYLMCSFLEVIAANKTKGLPQKIYEIGDRFRGLGGVEKALCFALVDNGVSFADARGVLQTIMKELGLVFSLKKITEENCLDPERSGSVYINGKLVGSIGEVKKEILDFLGLEFGVCMCEISLI